MRWGTSNKLGQPVFVAPVSAHLCRCRRDTGRTLAVAAGEAMLSPHPSSHQRFSLIERFLHRLHHRLIGRSRRHIEAGALEEVDGIV